jgi:hypothetical protein
MNAVFSTRRSAGLLAAVAILLGQARVACAQTVLIDFGSDTSYRGLSVDNPDDNGNYWNSVQPGLLVPLVDIENQATTVQLGWDTPVATDSYNGPAGATSDETYQTDVFNTVIDPQALGLLGGALEAPFDYAAGYDGIDHFPVRFQIQGLNPAATYDLTFFGSHAFSNDMTTVYTVYSDDTYMTEIASTMLDIQGPDAFFEPNRDRVATITGVAPQADNILYIEFVGATGFGGYLNDLLIETNAPPLTADFDGDGDVDGDDLAVWRGDFADTGAVMADADNDGDADGADFLAWQRELGGGSLAAAASGVPEPPAFALAFGAAAVQCVARRRPVFRKRLGRR